MVSPKQRSKGKSATLLSDWMVGGKMEKFKIYYNADGWLCERYPYDLPVDDESRFIEVDEATFHKTLGC